MIRLKRIGALLLAIALVFTIAACGGDGEGKQQDPGKKDAQKSELKYPEKPIEMVIAFSPGGGSDTFGRAVAEYGGEYIGQTIHCTNKEGGAGAIGFNYGAKAPADGYTLTLAVTTLSAAPYTTKDYPVTYKDFAPLALVAVDPAAISVRADSKYQTLDDLIADAKAHPGALRLAQAGSGSPWHLACGALMHATGVDIQSVPFDGAGPSITALVGGHVDMVITSSAEIKPQVESGNVRTLAIMADERFPGMPDVPTTKELNIDAKVVGWRGVVAPKDTPKEICDYLINSLQKMAEDQKFTEFLEKQGLGLMFRGGDDFTKFLTEQDKISRELVETCGLGFK